MISDKNPNPKLKPTFQIANRRILIRPWMSELLLKCFKNIKVGFWGSKSKSFMDEMVPALLKRVKFAEPLVAGICAVTEGV
jgi:hypothetical protein